VAIPAFNVPVPRAVVPSLNVTVPVGVVPPADPVTVAVKVALAPTTSEVAEDVRTVVVELCATLTATTDDTEARFLLSPP